ncbi:MAG: cation-translocating P-type ATPase [Phycisphaerales bacterium]|nr:cation-translocating P-type ATPase [Phycisphaerales bacterium]
MSVAAVEREPSVPGALKRAPVSCAHCALPVPPGLLEPESERQFCCEACRTVYGVIHGCGLERYYALRESLADGTGGPARTTGAGYEEFDDEAFALAFVREREGGLLSAELFLEGVHCAACVWLVERLPRLVPGVAEARLDLGRSLVRVSWDPARVRLSEIARALDRLGYAPHPARDARARDAARREDRRFLVRIAVAGAIAGNCMLLALALYSGMVSGIEGEFRQFFRWISLGLGLLSLAWPGRVFFRGAIASLVSRAPRLDLPIAIGLAAAGVVGVVNVLRGEGDVYFDALTVLVFLLLSGRWLQHRQQRSAADAVELLYSLAPAWARVVGPDGATRRVSAASLRPGDTVEVRAEETIPADGVVESGRTEIDASVLTGESRPVSVGPGERVHAATTSLSGRVLVRVQAAGAETRVGRLMAGVEEAARRRAPIVALTDRIAGWFVLVVTTLAAITFLLWVRHDPAKAMESALALLIVTCPCALGLATPLAITAAVGRASRRGILIKGGAALERLARPGVMLLDKTGTVTQGRLGVVRWEGDARAIPLAAAVERDSSHPVARAIVAFAVDAPAPSATDVSQALGAGVRGTVDGRLVEVGSVAFIGDRPAWLDDAVARATGDALSPVVVAVDGRAVALAVLGDPIREDARASIESLRADGWRVRLLSGDHPEVVRAVGRSLGLDERDCIGGATPEEKLRVVEEHFRHGGATVVMVGDGVNDAAALARATVGVAVSGGAEASLAAADAYLRAPGLAPIVELCRGSRRTVRVIRRNLAASLAYNAVAVALCMAGLISSLLAAVLMPLSSLTVVFLSYRSRTFGGRA